MASGDEEALRATQPQGAEPWRRESAYIPSHGAQGATPGAVQGAAYGSGSWGSGYGQETPSGYGAPSATGYGQTCQGQSGYGQGPFGGGDNVSYASTNQPRQGTRSPWPGRMSRPAPDGFDLDYLQWRDEQLRLLDDDYQAWRQTRYRQFADEFNAWRSERQAHAGRATPETPAPSAAVSAPPSSSLPK